MTFDSSSSLLVTGGTGSFGRAFIAETLRMYPEIKRLVIFSRDELKQWELQQLYPEKDYPQISSFWAMFNRTFKTALDGIDTVVHATH